MQDGGQRKRKMKARARSLYLFAHEIVRKLGRVRIWIAPRCSSFFFQHYTGQNPFLLSNVWGSNGLHTGNHKVWGKIMIWDVFHAVCIILPHDVFLRSWDMTFVSSIGWYIFTLKQEASLLGCENSCFSQPTPLWGFSRLCATVN